MRLWIVIAALLAGGCGSDDPSDLVVYFSSDLSIPDQIDAIKLTAKYATKTDRFLDISWSVNPADSAAIKLPARVRLIPSAGSAGRTIELELRGLLGGSPVVSEQASLQMPSGSPLTLPLALTKNCVSKSCPSGRTCIAGECSAIGRSLGALKAWTESNDGELQAIEPP